MKVTIQDKEQNESISLDNITSIIEWPGEGEKGLIRIIDQDARMRRVKPEGDILIEVAI